MKVYKVTEIKVEYILADSPIDAEGKFLKIQEWYKPDNGTICTEESTQEVMELDLDVWNSTGDQLLNSNEYKSYLD